MSSVASILMLLQAVVQLLLFVQKNPNLPNSFKQDVFRQAVQAISLAKNSLSPSITPTVSPVSSAAVINAPAVLPATTTPANVVYTSPGGMQVIPKPAYSFSYIAVLIHNGINQERARAGLDALSWNQSLVTTAEAHSQDQARDNASTTDPAKPCAELLIRHEGLTPAGFSLGDRLRHAAIPFIRGGENIAMLGTSKNLIYRFQYPDEAVTCPAFSPELIPETASDSEKQAIITRNNQNAKDAMAGVRSVVWVNKEWLGPQEIADHAVQGWMESPGHRANILTAAFKEEGIGIAEANEYMIITEDFRTP